jgi:hypothetical protein
VLGPTCDWGVCWGVHARVKIAHTITSQDYTPAKLIAQRSSSVDHCAIQLKVGSNAVVCVLDKPDCITGAQCALITCYYGLFVPLRIHTSRLPVPHSAAASQTPPVNTQPTPLCARTIHPAPIIAHRSGRYKITFFSLHSNWVCVSSVPRPKMCIARICGRIVCGINLPTQTVQSCAVCR